MSDRESRIERWIAEARSGSAESLEALIKECRNYLLTIANRAVSDALRKKVGASDLVQDTLVEAVRDFGHFQGNRLAELLAWLRGILLHNAANASRHYEQTEKRDVSREVSLEGQREALSIADPSASPASKAAICELDERLDTALCRLPHDMRLVIELRNRDHLSFQEVGQQMDRSADAARKLWARAIEKLRTHLADLGAIDR